MSTIEDRWLEQKRAEFAQRNAAMLEEAERMIAASRKSIQPRLRQVLEECQADYDEEGEFGWAHSPYGAHKP